MQGDGSLVIPDTHADPWWTLDSKVLPDGTDELCDQNPNTESQNLPPPNEDNEASISTPCRSLRTEELSKTDDSRSESVNEDIREVLNTLKSLTYLNTDVETAKTILSKLKEVQQSFVAVLPKEHSIHTISRPVTEKKERKRKRWIGKNRKGLNRPAKYRKFSKFGRFGDFVVTDLKSCQTESTKQTSQPTFKPQPQISIAPTLNQSRPSKPSAPTNNPQPTGQSISKLANYDKVLDPQYWLSSDELYDALRIIQEQFPSVEAQDPLLIQRRQCFNPVDSIKDYCQILHVNGNHWVAATNIRCKPNQVAYFDSMGLEPSQKALQAIASK